MADSTRNPTAEGTPQPPETPGSPATLATQDGADQDPLGGDEALDQLIDGIGVPDKATPGDNGQLQDSPAEDPETPDDADEAIIKPDSPAGKALQKLQMKHANSERRIEALQQMVEQLSKSLANPRPETQEPQSDPQELDLSDEDVPNIKAVRSLLNAEISRLKQEVAQQTRLERESAAQAEQWVQEFDRHEMTPAHMKGQGQQVLATYEQRLRAFPSLSKLSAEESQALRQTLYTEAYRAVESAALKAKASSSPPKTAAARRSRSPEGTGITGASAQGHAQDNESELQFDANGIPLGLV